jgi:hypothetical protein
LIPWWIKNSIGKEYVFSKQYDALVKQFSSPNHLAESLSSEDKELRENANLLMCHNNEHINKGIGWYLKNGKTDIKIFFLLARKKISLDFQNC